MQAFQVAREGSIVVLILAQTCSVWHECNTPCSLNSRRDLPLMSGTIAGYSPRDNLAPLRGKEPERLRVLVVYDQATVRTEPTDLSPAEYPLALLIPRHLSVPPP